MAGLTMTFQGAPGTPGLGGTGLACPAMSSSRRAGTRRSGRVSGASAANKWQGPRRGAALRSPEGSGAPRSSLAPSFPRSFGLVPGGGPQKGRPSFSSAPPSACLRGCPGLRREPGAGPGGAAGQRGRGRGRGLGPGRAQGPQQASWSAAPRSHAVVSHTGPGLWGRVARNILAERPPARGAHATAVVSSSFHKGPEHPLGVVPGLPAPSD